MNPYRQCPIYQNENYRIRFVKQSDVNDLLKVYSDPKTVALCNCDNCEDDFYYTARPVGALKHNQLSLHAHFPRSRAPAAWTSTRGSLAMRPMRFGSLARR